MKLTVNPPMPLRIQIPAHVGSNFEGLVIRVDEADGGEAHRTSPLEDQWELYDLTDDPPKPSTGGAIPLSTTSSGTYGWI